MRHVVLALALAACGPTDVCHDLCVTQVRCYDTDDLGDRLDVADCYEPYDRLLEDGATHDHTLESCDDALGRFSCPL